MEGKRIVLVVALGLLAALVAAPAGGKIESRVYEEMSCSPLNNGLGGTSLFVADMRQRAKVALARSVDEAGNGSLYLIIGPDLPLSPRESGELSRLVREGRINLLVADETDNTRGLLSRLGLPGLGETVLNTTASGPGWKYIVHMECGGRVWVASRARSIIAGNGTVICRYVENGEPAAVLYRVGKGRVLVVGDSSIFSNYLYGGLTFLGSSREMTWRLLEEVWDGRSPVVIDNSHYIFRRVTAPMPQRVLHGMVVQLVSTLESLSQSAATAPVHWLLAGVAAATLPWPIILLYPGRRERGPEEPLENLEAVLLEIELGRAGLPAGLSPEEALNRLGG